MEGAGTGQESDRLSEAVLLLLSTCCPRHFFLCGRRVCRRCCCGGLCPGALRVHDCGPGHVVVRHLGLAPSMEPCDHDYGLYVHPVRGHGRYCVLRYVLGGRPRFGHAFCWYLTVESAAERQVGKEDDCQRIERTLWARGPYGKDERKP